MPKPKTSKPAAGLAGLIARPGAAARPKAPEPAPRAALQAGQEGHGAPAAVASGALKALTVKLTPELYRRLRLHAAGADTTHQAVLVAALTQYLDASR